MFKQLTLLAVTATMLIGCGAFMYDPRGVSVTIAVQDETTAEDWQTIENAAEEWHDKCGMDIVAVKDLDKQLTLGHDDDKHTLVVPITKIENVSQTYHDSTGVNGKTFRSEFDTPTSIVYDQRFGEQKMIVAIAHEMGHVLGFIHHEDTGIMAWNAPVKFVPEDMTVTDATCAALKKARDEQR